MKKTLVPALVLTLLVFSRNLSLAWDGAGHMTIAAEAFRALPTKLKAESFDVLKFHPDFAKWTNSFHPNPNIDLATYVFMRASTWPDEIRRSGSQYDHPNWHFIDYPLRPPAFPIEPDARPTDNILYGIAQCEATSSDTNAASELRAVYLSWLIHLVGDIHQPLHCESFYSDAYPNGDRGGNDFYVKPVQSGVRLHGIWDGLLGSSVNPKTQWKYALTIDKEYPQKALPEVKADRTPKDWSLESRGLAITNGYLNGNLKGGKDAESAPPLPDGYTK